MNTNWFPRGILVSACILFGVALTSPAHAEHPRYLFGTPQAVTPINDPNLSERDPSLTADGLEIYFYRGTTESFPGPEGVNLYMSKRTSTSEHFGPPQALDEVNSVNYFTLQPEISPDGLTLYYARMVNNGPGSPYGRGTIWSATRPTRDVPFGNPVEITGFNDLPDPAKDSWGSPSVSADGLTLYLSIRKNIVLENYDDADIYVATRSSLHDPWPRPALLRPFDNVSEINERPAISADSRSLFYDDVTSDLRRDGLRDIYLSVREKETNPWTRGVNLGDTINTGEVEAESFLARDGSSLYFRRGGGDSGTEGEVYQAPILPFDVVPLHGGNGSYQQDFNSLGTNATLIGNPLPAGWTFTANDVVFNNATTESFNVPRNWATISNAGLTGDADRAPVTRNIVNQENGEFDLRVLIEDAPAQALQLAFDLEVWQVLGSAASVATAGFHVVLEADSGTGFFPIADLGQVDAPSPLPHPATGTLVNGNDPQYRVAFDSGLVDVDVPEGATLRVRWIASDDSIRSVFGIDNVSLQFVNIADLNGDGSVDSDDAGTMFANWGRAGAGDLTHDNIVDAADAGRLFAAWTADSGPLAVPEPNSMVTVLALCLTQVTVGRRALRDATSWLEKLSA